MCALKGSCEESLDGLRFREADFGGPAENGDSDLFGDADQQVEDASERRLRTVGVAIQQTF